MDIVELDEETNMKLQRIFGKGKNYEIIPETKINKFFRYYKIEGLTKRVNYYMNKKIIDMDETYFSLFDKLKENGINVFIKGGAIRDFFLKKVPNDIDIIFQSNEETLKSLCKKYNWPCGRIDPMYKFILFGKDINSIDGIYDGDTILKENKFQYDYTVNYLLYDMTNKHLIDMTGFGLIDAIHREVRISVNLNYFNKWVNDGTKFPKGWKKPLRFFKLLQLGFKPYNRTVLNTIVNYIENNFDTLYMKKMNNPPYNTRIRHFLIRTLSKVEIDKEGSYLIQDTNCEVIKNYLNVLNKYLKPEIMQLIYSQVPECL